VESPPPSKGNSPTVRFASANPPQKRGGAPGTGKAGRGGTGAGEPPPAGHKRINQQGAANPHPGKGGGEGRGGEEGRGGGRRTAESKTSYLNIVAGTMLCRRQLADFNSLTTRPSQMPRLRNIIPSVAHPAMLTAFCDVKTSNRNSAALAQATADLSTR
jgi:hypothetical protein